MNEEFDASTRRGLRCCPKALAHKVLCSWRRLVGGVAAAVLALAADAVMLADAAAEALLARAPDAVMLAYARSPAFLADVLGAAVLAFLRRHLE